MGGWIGLFIKRLVSAHRVKADTCLQVFFSQRGDVGGWGGAGSRRNHGPEENQGPGNAKQGREQAEPRMAKHGKKLGGRTQVGTGVEQTVQS